MKTEKKLGIWMDHANAHVMEFDSHTVDTKTVESKFTHHEKEESFQKNEHLMHNKEQHEQSAYYKTLGNIIKNYDEVILFGPTDAKKELYNLLAADHHFANVKIDVKQADKMSENQQHAFVKEHFTS